jgi:sucrose-6-phosphate hydrolase SacC (GH32 family)
MNNIILSKLGKIFDPTKHELQNFDCSEFAQSPQAVVFDDFVRIYFSTRKRDEFGLFLSVVRFIDFSKDFKTIKSFSKKEVIPLGKLGTFDEHGIFPFSPFVQNDKITAFTCGWSRRVSVPVETSTGYVVSEDNGMTFSRIGNGPVLTSSKDEPYLVGDSFVKFFNGKFHMWYIYGSKWIEATENEPVARVYKIAYASSKDGIDWTKDTGKQIISDIIDENECQALPTVIFKNGYYHMFFCYRHATDFRTNPQRGYKLGYAFSKDLINWSRQDNLISFESNNESTWDNEMMCYPNLFEMDNEFFLLYNGNYFGKFGFGIAKFK